MSDNSVPSYGQPAVEPMLESEARQYSLLIHLIAAIAVVLSAGFLGFVAPLVIWLMFRQRSALVDFHGKQQLNLQITVLLGGLAAMLVGLALFGVGIFVTLPLYFAYWVYSIVISFIAASKANSGLYYPIRFAIPFLK
ncbi:DUF4870 domain-containing protein [Demequina sp. NBRC 110055]|uniref:DUF4870 domain-containing protein n=1 Tax=Demequina sp. NBRC 110055 TaxID=1570344 RepID=UPI0013563E86|nr:DUF4870 domain-containing protein [Demequina sp. NBRC 110055]